MPNAAPRRSLLQRIFVPFFIRHNPQRRLSHILSGPYCPVLSSVLLELPVPIVQGTNGSGLQPPRNAMEVECMVADAPGHGAFFTGSGCLVCLTFDTQIHDVITADSTVVDHDVPCPKSYCVPLLNLELLLALNTLGVGALGLFGDGRIAHLNISHGG